MADQSLSDFIQAALRDDAQVRRPGAGRFVPKSEAPTDSGVIVQRNVLQPSRGEKKLTSRQRRIAGNLPSWEPLPPDELLVRRGV